MSSVAALIPITTEELLAMPQDGVERELIRGELRERPMTRRNPRHSSAEAAVAGLLRQWWKQQPEPRGQVFSGEAGFRILRNPDTTVGIDVAYILAELAVRTPQKARLIDGPPILAVEILSPSDTQEDITDKIGDYLAAGVPLVWVIETVFRTVSVYRPDTEPEMFNVRQELSAEPHLPGLRVAVSEIFET
jgi:Uma2 family endonuclease